MADPNQAQASAGLFCLAMFLAIAVAGALYVERRMALAERKRREQVEMAAE